MSEQATPRFLNVEVLNEMGIVLNSKLYELKELHVQLKFSDPSDFLQQIYIDVIEPLGVDLP